MKILTLGFMVATLVAGCGMGGNAKVPKEQIDADIATKTVKVQEGGTTWMFSGDSQRCFAVVDNESKYGDKTADVMVNVASWRDISIGSSQIYSTVFGKMLMTYKNDGGKWTLEKVEPKDLISKSLETEEFKKFVEIQMPLCKYSRTVN